MRTIVFQSYRTHDVPAWIDTCLASVREWAASRGYEYRFYDDRFFAYAPEWFRRQVGQRILPVSDLARLRLAQALLEEGWERTVWVDADMLVFAPAIFSVEVPGDYAFVREVWTWVQDGRMLAEERVNNSVSVFCRGNALLDFYVHGCEQAARNHRELSDWHVGTVFLTALHRMLGLPLITTVGIASPQVLRELVQGTPQLAAAYMGAVGAPLGAINLCASFAGRTADGVRNEHADYARAVATLLESGGAALNALLPAAAPQPVPGWGGQ